jgi:signal peptidase II
MSLRNKASRVFLASLVFFVLCHISHQLLGQPAVCNTGIGLGIETPRAILIILMVLTLLLASFLFRNILQNTAKLTPTVLLGGSFLFGGALSNIVDRLLIGCVPDFFHIGWFPAFNVADIGISLGAFLLLVSIVYKKEA